MIAHTAGKVQNFCIPLDTKVQWQRNVDKILMAGKVIIFRGKHRLNTDFQH